MVKHALKTIRLVLSVLLISLLFNAGVNRAYAGCCSSCFRAGCQMCSELSEQTSDLMTEQTTEYITQSFIDHREWMVDVFFEDFILQAMMRMTQQLTAVAMQQVQIVGSFLDAKHQLETQRLFQELHAQAHKDYHPSRSFCALGTNTRSLAASERNADLSLIAISNRTMQRQLLSGENVATDGSLSDRRSRMDQYISQYCDRADNGNALRALCQNSGATADRMNKDIDYTRMIENAKTLEIDFANDPNPSDDEQDLLALGANLYGHDVFPYIAPSALGFDRGEPNKATEAYMNLRSVAAKRSVAKNSFAAIAAQKAEGNVEVQPYMARILEEMGVPEADITEFLGERPSYFAQMEVLTKKIYQNPHFYIDLYDKPANIERKQVALQAIELMQKRDMFRSLLRAEATTSVMLELAVMKEQTRVKNEVQRK